MVEALKIEHCCGGIRRGRSKVSDTLGVAVAIIERQEKKIVAEGLMSGLGRMSARGL